MIVPRAAHIRKAYTRDETLPGLKDAEDSESVTQTHRLLRRGIPFGTSFRPSLGATGHGGKFGVEEPNDRGLLFLAYQSDIERQFEFVQNNWVNNVNFPQSGDGQDPIDPVISWTWIILFFVFPVFIVNVLIRLRSRIPVADRG